MGVWVAGDAGRVLGAGTAQRPPPGSAGERDAGQASLHPPGPPPADLITSKPISIRFSAQWASKRLTPLQHTHWRPRTRTEA